MKIGTFATFMSPLATPQMLGDFARRAEEAGVHALWMGEHVVLFDEMEFPYPGSPDGRIPVPEGGGMLDTVATIGYVSAVTSTIRFSTGITLLPQRNPVYTAKEFTTLDWLSGGRVDMGVGVGWCKEEVIACGYSWEDRGARCDEFLEAIRRMWTQEIAAFEGQHFTLPACRCDPKPLQSPHVPIIVGGTSGAAFRRAARFGQGWYGFNMTAEQAGICTGRLDTALAAVGRSRENFQIIITPPYQATDEDIKAYADIGVDQLVFHLGSQRAHKIDERLRQLEHFVAAAG